MNKRIAMCCSLIVLTGCATKDLHLNSRVAERERGFKIGDELSLEFGGCLKPEWIQTIGEDGMLSLPFNQHVYAEGTTRRTLEEQIEDLYVPRIVSHLTVIVSRVEAPGSK